jgi:putative acetyltransferase
MIKLRATTPSDEEDLFHIWLSAVEATHHFLTPEDQASIEPLVHDYVRTSPLLGAEKDGRLVAFMGQTERNIDSLFIHAGAHRMGIGRTLVERVGSPATVDVNEQNESGVSFYRHMGFEVVGRSELDDDGRPYPLLHMRKG